MNDQVLRLLSSKITDIDFRRDLRQQLRASPYLAQAKVGWLDEAIARGFGYKSHAALLQSTDRDVSEISDAGFRDRMVEFGCVAPGNLFRKTVLQLINPGEAPANSFPLPVVLDAEQLEWLEDILMQPSNLLVCGSDPEANSSMLVELVHRMVMEPFFEIGYALAAEKAGRGGWFHDADVLTMPLPEDVDRQKDLFKHILRLPGYRCIIDGITPATLDYSRDHLITGVSCFVSMASQRRDQDISAAVDLFMQGLRSDRAPMYLHSVVHVEVVDGAVRIVDSRQRLV